MLKNIKLLLWKNQRLTKFNNIKIIYPQRNRKIIKMTNKPPPQKNDTFEIVEESGENMVKEAYASLTSTKNNIDT